MFFKTLQDIDAISSDTLYTNGGCGKGGQMPLPVSVGGPHIRIKKRSLSAEDRVLGRYLQFLYICHGTKPHLV